MIANSSLEEYIAGIEVACGEEKNIIVNFKPRKKDETITKILKKAKVERSIAGIIFDLTYNGLSIRLYRTGKAVFKKVEGKDQILGILAELLL